MIDTKELRRLAQAATPGPWYAGNGTYEGRNIYSVVSVTDSEGFTYPPVIATAEDNDTPLWAENISFIAAVNPAVLNELLDRLEAAEKSDAESIAMYRKARDERDELRAKIEAMEKQEPVVEVQWAAGIPNSFLDFISTDGYLPKLGDKLYALPGAKGE